ncbi:MAG: hypothetical protein QM708_14060 [Propioniciclava sp.]|uniref:hypothetical protein n=1 Tax=Propioniciclava sp. TaxID=2038686 RepID=UPI0039E35F8F
MSDAWSEVDPALPLALLPVRVETRSRLSADEPGAVELRVRIYPDELAFDAMSGRALLLPESFRVIAVQGEVVSEQDGAPIAGDDLGVGLGQGLGSGDVGDEQFEGAARTLRDLADGVGDSAWLGDYDLAVARGFAVTVRLGAGAEKIDRLYVIGVNRADPQSTADALAAALRTQPECALCAAGTPTNNTTNARSGGVGNDGAPAAAQAVVQALGLHGAETIDGWPSTATDPSLPGLMASALWPVAWGPWLRDTFSDRVLGLYDRLDVHDHLLRWVRPEGPFPVLRVGRQPYGILPVTLTGEVTGKGRGARLVTGAVRAAWPSWRDAPPPPSVRDGDLATALPSILGLAPSSGFVRVRHVLHTDNALDALMARVLPDFHRRRTEATREAEQRLGLAPGSLRQLPYLGDPRILGLPLVDETDPKALAGLVDAPAEPADASVLQVLLSVARGDSLARARAARRTLVALIDNEGWIRQIESGGPDDAERARESLAQILIDALAKLGGASGDPQAFVETLQGAITGDLLDIDAMTIRDHMRPLLEHLRKRFGTLILTAHRTPLYARLKLAQTPSRLTQAREILGALLEYLAAVDEAARVVLALPTLAGVTDSDQRARLLAGALDTASHRLDAWTTSLATRRLDLLRAANGTGVVVGAFAWLEDIVLTPPPTDPDAIVTAQGVGWMQAPSPTHAATAAVLRSARLSHAPDDGPDSPLELDLSSTRTREAVDIVRGMREGQQLAALLGYRFERWLNDADQSLNRFVLALRALAPLIVGRETPPSADATTTALTGAVVDGLALIDKTGEIRAALETDDPRWDPPRPGEVARIEVLVRRLASLADAIADLMLAEGVHQLVAGDAARATAAMNAMSGDVIPEEPAVPLSPAARDGMTHRVAVLGAARPATDADAGWTPSVRAISHPFLETWCREALGRADRIVLVSTDGGFDDLSAVPMSALDLVMAADGTDQGLTRFWARCRRRRPSLPEEWLTTRPAALSPDQLTLREAWQLASAVRAVLSSARAAIPDDLVASGESPAAARHVADEAATAQRLAAAVAALRPLTDPLPAGGTAQDVAALLARADALADAGIGDDTDPGTLGSDPDALRSYLAGLVGALEGRLVAADAAADPGAVTDALGSLVGRLPVVEDLDPQPEPPLADRLVAGDAGAAPRRWVARMTTVRPAVAGWATLSALRRATGRAGELRLAVFGADRWVGDTDLPAHPATSLLIEPVSRFDAAGPIAGLVVDTWSEHRPAQRTMDAPEGEARREELVATGLAVHANGPAARAAHAVLLAVSPDGAPWSAERIVAVIDEVRTLLRLRLATPGSVAGLGDLLPAVGVGHWSLADEQVLDPRLLRQAARFVPSFVKGG